MSGVIVSNFPSMGPTCCRETSSGLRLIQPNALNICFYAGCIIWSRHIHPRTPWGPVPENIVLHEAASFTDLHVGWFCDLWTEPGCLILPVSSPFFHIFHKAQTVFIWLCNKKWIKSPVLVSNQTKKNYLQRVKLERNHPHGLIDKPNATAWREGSNKCITTQV